MSIVWTLVGVIIFWVVIYPITHFVSVWIVEKFNL